jgi:hypothetical protein
VIVDNYNIFNSLLENLKVGETADMISFRRDEITKALNKKFRNKDDCVDYKLMVGSFGRHTAIKGVSDLDMVYILPPKIRSKYSDVQGPRRILSQVRDILKSRYPNTDIHVDQCVVCVKFIKNKFKFEIQPVFENKDGSFEYPDTKSEKWKITKPREEIEATKECNDRTSNNMRYLARMVRAWKNTYGVNMGGLVIDTLVYNFLSQTNDYSSAGIEYFPEMVRDFFKFLKDEPNKDFYLALGSKQHVYVKGDFHIKAEKAYNICLQAIEDKNISVTCKKWRKIFGTYVSLGDVEESKQYNNTEQFIENIHPMNISGSIKIDCEVTQKGWRPSRLRDMLLNRIPLKANKKLEFHVIECTVNSPYTLKWKILNRGEEAERRDMVRGQIIESSRKNSHVEYSNFRGNHIVECYVIKDGFVVARDYIDVPIDNTVSG